MSIYWYKFYSATAWWTFWDLYYQCKITGARITDVLHILLCYKVGHVHYGNSNMFVWLGYNIKQLRAQV
jgi:hypothetical protein